MSDSRNLLRTVAVAAMLAASAGTTDAALRFNEIMVNAPGTNAGKDFIELQSTTGGVESVVGVTVLFLEGDAGAATGTGSIDHVLPLGDIATGTNGLFIRHDFATPPAFDPATTIQTGAWAHENLAITYLLVTGFSGAVGDDLDTDNDGKLDTTPWTSVLDAQGFADGGANDRTYGAALGGQDFTKPPSNSDVIAFVRDPSGSGHVGEVSGSGAGPYTIVSSATIAPGYALTPGASNTPVPEPAAVGLAGVGVAGLLARRRRRAGR